MPLISSSVYEKVKKAIAGVGFIVRTSTSSALTSDPTISSGSGAPSAAEPAGSIYLRTNGTSATVIYVRASGAWTAVAAAGTDFAAAGIAADVVAESTAAAGVTIDGLLVKDGDARIGDSNVLSFGTDQDILYTHDGSASVRVTNAAAGTVDYDDDVLRIVDPASPTKIARLDAGNITAGQTRVITAADRDVDLEWVPRRLLVTIAAGAVATLNASPVAVIPAPGVGKYIEILGAVKWWLDYGTVAYDAAAAGDTLGLKYTNGSGAQLVDTVAGNAIGAATADYHVLVQPVAEVVPVANAAVVAHIDTGEWYAAAGDSPLKVEVFYRIRNLEPAS